MKRVVQASGASNHASASRLPWTERTVTHTRPATTGRQTALPDAEGPTPPRQVHRGPSRFVRLHTGRILVTSADTYERLRLEAMLLAHGYTVVSASTFEEATNVLQTMPVDLIVTSIRLAAFNGLHLAMRSRSHDPQRTVIVTHDTIDLTLKEQAEAQGVRYIADPLENPEFLPSVEEALGGPYRFELMV